MKTRLNFTIEEKTSEIFKKICDKNSINMSQLVEEFMNDYINKDSYYKTINEVISDIENIKDIAINNYKFHSTFGADLDLNNFEGENKVRKLVARILFALNIIIDNTMNSSTTRSGGALQGNLILMNEKYSKILEPIIINNKIANCEIYVHEKLDNYIICMRVLNEDDRLLIKMLNSASKYGALEHKDIDPEKHHVGFKIID